MASEVVTEERIERALVLVAYMITLDGPVYAPLFDRLERELEIVRRPPLARAKQLLERYTLDGAGRVGIGETG